MCTMFISYGMCAHAFIKVHADVDSKGRGLYFDMSVHLHSTL